jgi:hypothetical protein
MIETFVEITDSNLRKGNPFKALMVLINTKSHHAQTLSPDMKSAQTKDASVKFAKHVAKQMSADTMFLMSEAWSLSTKDLLRFEEILDRYGSIGSYPKRIDIAVFQLATDEGWFSATAPILRLPPSSKRRKLGLISWNGADQVEGSFAEILPN